MERRNRARLGTTIALTFFYFALFFNEFVTGEKYDEEDGKAYLKKINSDIQVKTTESVLASWAYESNITDENLRLQLDASAELANFTKEIWKETIKYPWKTFRDPDVRRQFQKFSVLGVAILSAEKYEEYNKIVSEMQSVYGKAKVCNYHNRTDCSLQLEPELTEIFSGSRDPDELRYYWEEWRNAAGKPVRKMYKKYVDLSNEAAALNNFTDTSEFWLKDYEAKDFKDQVESLWEQVKPLYLQLHAYVRKRLREQYGKEHVSKRGPIPAHLLGNMWAQTWGNVYNFTLPYPRKTRVDVTENMIKQGYTPHRMFKLAEEFFTSLGLSPMPETFWNRSILVKPNDGRDLVCHASAWDFYDGKDFRIKQCTRVNVEDLNTAHHEMGHIQYFLQYKSQPLVFKEGTNPGFHEAIGDVMALSVSTPKHLRKIGLLEEGEDDEETDINELFNVALDKIAFLPFGYLMDQWRWSVFQGKTTEKDYNCKWWQLREKYQGLSPSVVRSEADFDPGSKYHTIANVPYIRYFVSFVIQFQFHRSLCIAAKEYDPDNPTLKPLHQCDIYQSKEAGALLKKMLELGSSKPWPDAMEVLTGQRKMDASALLEYFSTLKTWLEKENERTGECIGWETSEQVCGYRGESNAASSLDLEGDFEGDNIAYSNAEFVHQEDNIFGMPDFAEETPPFYRSIPLRSKKNDQQQSEKKLWPKKLGKFSKTKKIFLPERPLEFSESNVLDISDLQNLEKALENMQQKQRKEEQQTKAEAESRILEHIRSRKPFIKEPFEIRSKYNDLERTKILNAILKDVHRLKVNKQGGSRIDGGEKAKETGDENALEVKENLKIGEESKAEELIRGSLESGAKEKMEIKEEKKFRHPHLTLSSREPLRSKSSKMKASSERQEPFGEDPAKSAETPVKEGRGECILENCNIKLKESDAERPADSLLWKSEQVKNVAEKMLKQFNFSAYENNPSNLSELLEAEEPNENAQEEDEEGKAEEVSDPKQAKARWNKYRNLMKNMKMRSIEETDLPLREYDLIQLIPIRVLRNSIGVKKAERRDNRKLFSSKGNLPGEDEDEELVMIVGKLSDGDSKKSVKKSYKEYHYNARPPVVYNSVVISKGGRTEKSEDLEDLHEESRPSRFQEEGDFQNDFSKSVRRKLININNILQYLGRLQILLDIHAFFRSVWCHFLIYFLLRWGRRGQR